jgi:protein-tyrosine phosphatase
MYDLHCHILPCMDDGPSSVEETRKMLKIAVQEGIQVIAATHHFFDDETTIEDYLGLWESRYKQIQSVLEGFKKDIQIVKGAEVMISPFLTQLDGLHRLCINEGRYLLIELPMIDLPQFTEEVIHNLQVKGIVPILAHPERNYRIANNPDLLNPLIELGALVQINTGSITGLFGKKIRRCAKTLFKNNMAHLIGTDAHSAVKRPPEMRKSAQILERWVGQQRAETILVENPRAIVNNIILEVIN